MVTSVKASKVEKETSAPACKVALAGFGTVGASVAKILGERYAGQLQLTHIYNRGVHRKRVPWVAKSVHWTENIDDILNSPDVDVFIELIGGLSPAEEWVRRALESGKSVVTANKQLIAARGPELLALAREHGQALVYGASVAGGVPVLSGLEHGLAGDKLVRVCGILNGTCNYMLTTIERERTAFDDVLKQAQKLGYAEADPTDDVDGFDARAKITIIIRTALNAAVKAEEIECRTIRDIDGVDFDYAHQLKCTIRQISRAELHGDTLFASVRPALVPLDSPLARAHANQNLVVSTGEYGGDIVFSGAGAGGNPTAVAVVSDVLAISNRTPGVANGSNGTPVERRVSADFTSYHYVRFTVSDRPGIIAALATIFSAHHINIDSVLQKPGYSKHALPFVITLEPCSNSQVERALADIGRLEFNVKPPVVLPILQ